MHFTTHVPRTIKAFFVSAFSTFLTHAVSCQVAHLIFCLHRNQVFVADTI